MAEDIKTVRQMIAYLRQQLEALGFVMSFLSFHQSDDQAQHHQPQPMIYHVINLAGYHPSKALIVGVRFMGGPEGLSIFQPSFSLLGEVKPQEGLLPWDFHWEIEEFGNPFAKLPDFQIQIDEPTLGDYKTYTAYIDEVCDRFRRLMEKYNNVLADRFTTDLFSFEGFVPRYSDEHLRRHGHHEQNMGNLPLQWPDAPYIWAALQTFPEGYIAFDPK
jgi:hypothetical protein